MTAIINTNPSYRAARIVNSYQTHAVRDLAWACFSPPLLHVEQLACASKGIASCQLQMTPARQRWLAELDMDATALLEHLSHYSSHRLGVYFERLWHFFLQHDPHTELVAHNLPIRDQNRTLGEFDCIYYCKQRNRHIHLELAVKFYLGVDTARALDAGAQASDWLGPDCHDRLDTKLEQLLQRQIHLADLPEAKSQLRELGIGKVAKEIALKGHLFWPCRAQMPVPEGYNHACGRNDWVHLADLDNYFAAVGADSALILSKMRWLSKALHIADEDRISHNALAQQLTQHFISDSYPRLVAALDSEGNELRRFFVTPDSWPYAIGSIRPLQY